MMLDNKSRGFSIIGVYHAKREAKSNTAKNRVHTAIAYRLRGSAEFTCEDQTFHADAGSMIYIPAGVDYTVDRSADELIIIHLNCYNEGAKRIEVLKDCGELSDSFLRLYGEWESADPAVRHNRCMSLLYSIFENAQKMIQKSNETIPAVIRAGVELLNAEFRNPDLTVSTLAAVCHVSEVYFRRLYKNHFGRSPLDSLLDLRFSYAKSLIKSGYYSTKAVASMSGFSDVKYFRTAFTRRVGMTPGAYRLTLPSPREEK